jgi:serine/threonine protein kinase
MIDARVRMLPITPSFPCNDSGLGRAPVYAAFSAATVLLKNIQKDAEEFVQSSSSAPISPFPYVQSLRRFPTNDSQQAERMSFRIIKNFEAAVNRLLYVAVADTSSPESKTILVKFSTKYSKELHHFCASHNFAPKLLAFEELPGGWFGIAMEYFPSACRMVDSPALVNHGEAWLKKMDEVVNMFHQHGYVHGDLRPPNFIVNGERLLLIDFDWGGQEGQATFPDIRLVPILRKDRGDILIRKHHDEVVLEDTKERISREIEHQKLKVRKRVSEVR